MSNHTTGPWYVCSEDLYDGDGVVVRVLAEDKGSAPWIVCDVIECAGMGEDPILANARLIAAAPLMLEALVKVLVPMELLEMKVAQEIAEVALVRKAIAAATGKEQG